MELKILFADDLHFHKRGFKSLFEFIEKYKIKHHFIKHSDKKLLQCFGNYKSFKSKFLDNYEYVEKFSKKELFSYRHKAINIYKLSKAEMLTYTMTLPNWYNEKIPYDDRFIFDKLYTENKELLLLNMGVAIYWVEFWQDVLKNNEQFTHCCIFSGSLIYQKSLIEISKNTPMEAMIFEHFFTGNNYYCEHKYDHIANNSDIKFSNYYNKVLDIQDIDNISFENEKIKAINKVINTSNKNVKQPERVDEKIFHNEQKTVLILGQVINDFSIIETKLENICSLSFYKELIFKIVDNTDFNVIFKAHPWERQKANLKSSLTYNELMKFIINNNFHKRVILVEDYNLTSLFEQSNIITTFCSQSALEASFVGKKVVQFGDAFYGKKGFTYDYKSIDTFIKNCNNLNETLTLDEYSNYELFLLKVLQLHLVCIHPSGIKSLEAKFNKRKVASIVSSNYYKLNNIKNIDASSKKKILLQRPKRIPMIGKFLLFIKHKILGWTQ